MDGERRVAQQMRSNKYFRADCSFKFRFAARGFALLFLATAILRGAIVGGHLDYPGSPWNKLPGQLAGAFGLAAIDIQVSGLQHHDPREVLEQIGVKPGGPIIGFDAKKARAKLQTLDWVESAVVIRRFPNQLQIVMAEREPFVVWQHEGRMEVVDQNGKPMTGVSLSSTNVLLHVVGEGANTAASLLVNQMSATPELMQEVKAAVRVGDRRWDIHMNSGLVIQLPEDNTAKAIKIAEANYVSGAFKTLPLQSVDFRIEGQTGFFAPQPSTLQPADPTTTSSIQ